MSRIRTSALAFRRPSQSTENRRVNPSTEGLQTPLIIYDRGLSSTAARNTCSTVPSSRKRNDARSIESQNRKVKPHTHEKPRRPPSPPIALDEHATPLPPLPPPYTCASWNSPSSARRHTNSPSAVATSSQRAEAAPRPETLAEPPESASSVAASAPEATSTQPGNRPARWSSTQVQQQDSRCRRRTVGTAAAAGADEVLCLSLRRSTSHRSSTAPRGSAAAAVDDSPLSWASRLASPPSAFESGSPALAFPWSCKLPSVVEPLVRHDDVGGGGGRRRLGGRSASRASHGSCLRPENGPAPS